MTISESTMNLYRTTTEIKSLIEVLVDSYLNSLLTRVGKREATIIEKLRDIKIDISPQIMNIFKAPLNNIHFKDIINQTIVHLIHEIIEKARLNEIITQEEADLMSIVLSTES